MKHISIISFLCLEFVISIQLALPQNIGIGEPDEQVISLVQVLDSVANSIMEIDKNCGCFCSPIYEFESEFFEMQTVLDPTTASRFNTFLESWVLARFDSVFFPGEIRFYNNYYPEWCPSSARTGHYYYVKEQEIYWKGFDFPYEQKGSKWDEVLWNGSKYHLRTSIMQFPHSGGHLIELGVRGGYVDEPRTFTLEISLMPYLG